MDKHYSSFFIRCWSSLDGTASLVIEHIESGQLVASSSLAEAQQWLARWALVPPAGLAAREAQRQRFDHMRGGSKDSQGGAR